VGRKRGREETPTKMVVRDNKTSHDSYVELINRSPVDSLVVYGDSRVLCSSSVSDIFI